jgi:hypothetical protein
VSDLQRIRVGVVDQHLGVEPAQQAEHPPADAGQADHADRDPLGAHPRQAAEVALGAVEPVAVGHGEGSLGAEDDRGEGELRDGHRVGVGRAGDPHPPPQHGGVEKGLHGPCGVRDEAQAGSLVEQARVDPRAAPAGYQHLRAGQRPRDGIEHVQHLLVQVHELRKPVEDASGEEVVTHSRRHRQDGARSRPDLRELRKRPLIPHVVSPIVSAFYAAGAGR